MTTSDSQQMVEEAYAAIEAIHTVPPVRTLPVPTAWQTSRIAIEQMYQSNLITKREMMEQLTAEWNAQP